MQKLLVTICASINFYEQVVKIRNQLVEMGYEVLIPLVAEQMAEQNNYDVATFKPRVEEEAGKHRKTELMHLHMEKVAKGDICLVVNNEKHGVPNYIGGNVLMEMSLAFHQRKPIVLLNEIPTESVYLEEIIGMQPIVLHGKIEDMPAALDEPQAQDQVQTK